MGDAEVKRDFHIVPHSDGWAVSREGVDCVISVHKSQAEAIATGHAAARRNHVQLVTHDEAGRIISSEGIQFDSSAGELKKVDVSRTPEPSDRLKTLETLLGYLREHHGNQVASLSAVDAKVGLRLTICGGLGVVVGLLLPGLLPAAGAPLYAALIAAATFFGCFARTLWLGLSSIEVVIHRPAVSHEGIAGIANHTTPDPEQVLVDLVRNYLDAIAQNESTVQKRSEPGDRLYWWSKATLLSSCVAVAVLLSLSGAKVVFNGEQERVKGENMADKKNESGSPATSRQGGSEQSGGGSRPQPSLQKPAEPVAFGKAQTTHDRVFTQQPAKPPAPTDKK